MSGEITPNQISRESVRLFKNSNMLLRYWSHEDDSTLRILRPNDFVDHKLSPVQVATLGTVAILTKNPIVSRRFWSTS